IVFMEYTTGEGIKHFLLNVVLWETIGAVAAGMVLGYVAGKILLWTQRNPVVDHPSLLAATLALAMAALGLVKLLQSDGLLAVFVAGLILDMQIEDKYQARNERIQEVISRFIDLPIFFLLGLALPWQEWFSMGWPLVFFALLVLLFRRLPALFLLYPAVNQLKDKRDALFAGWFGPIGVAALYYATYAQRETGMSITWNLVSFIIFASVIVHGFTATVLTKNYDKIPGAKS
ncbi:MAG: cation:proton antiporter, partial [Calditrichia bacterium]